MEETNISAVVYWCFCKDWQNGKWREIEDYEELTVCPFCKKELNKQFKTDEFEKMFLK